MSVKSYKSVQLVDFSGPALRLEQTDVPSKGSLWSTNCEYDPGQVSTRCGFTQVWNPNEAILSMFSWVKTSDPISADGSYLAYLTTTPVTPTVKLVANLANPTAAGGPFPLFTQAGAVAAQFSSAGNFLNVATINAQGTGAGQGRLVGIYGAALYTDKLFTGPLYNKPNLTNIGTGVVTQGDHRVGYIVTTRNGFTGKVSPVSAVTGSFDDTSVITAPGEQMIHFDLTATWPAEAQTLYPVMTPTTNLNRYFIVPDSGWGVFGGGTSTVLININISDDDLISTGTEVTDQVDLLTQDVSGTGPFYPFLILPYGQRTVYFTEISGVARYYASDVAKPQNITADQHVRYLPGQRKIKSAFVLGGVLYVLGPHWTYADFDNPNVVPAQWAAPQEVDKGIGTMGVLACTVNSSQGFALSADEGGLYLFRGGAFEQKPISYYDQPTWSRINLNAGDTVQVKDNKDKQEVIVLAPLISDAVVNTNGTAVTWVSGDLFNQNWKAGTPVRISGVAYTVVSATATTMVISADAGVQTAVKCRVIPDYCTHLLKYDYSDGLTADKVKPSLYDIVTYNPGAIEIVPNGTSKHLELWISSNSPGVVGRQMNIVDDYYPFNDYGLAIDSQFETALLPGSQAPMGVVYRHQSVQVRVKGLGTLAVTSYAIDRRRTFDWMAIAMSENPGQEYLRRIALNSEGASHRFRTNAVNEYFILSAVRHFYSDGPLFR